MGQKSYYSSLRGVFNNLDSYPALRNKKRMIVSLLKTQLVSFDLLLNSEIYNDKMKSQLENLENEITSYSDRCMVYFICVRNKVRFREKANPIKYIKIDIFRGENEVYKTIKLKIKDVANKLEIFSYKSVICKEDRICFHLIDEDRTCFIHDFLERCKINTGNVSKIVYVGETDFPLNRPFDRPHLGMMRVIYNYKNLGNDIFIYYNLFQIRYFDIRDETSSISMIFSNSLIELLDKKNEGRFIQNAFIYRLLSSGYSKNYKNEIGELNNKLNFLAEKYNVLFFDFNYSVNSGSDFYVFSSEMLESSSEIIFSLRSNTNSTEIKI